MVNCPLSEYDVEVGEVRGGELRDYPIGQQCVVERMFIRQRTIEYIQYLEVDPSNPVEKAIVDELAILDLYKYRAAAILAIGDKQGQGQDFTVTNTIGFNEEGKAATVTVLHPVFDAMDRIEKRKMQWLDRLMQTRKSRAEFLERIGKGQDSKIMDEIQKLRVAIEGLKEGDPVVMDVPAEEVLLEGAL
jgi:hypothetical protein